MGTLEDVQPVSMLSEMLPPTNVSIGVIIDEFGSIMFTEELRE